MGRSLTPLNLESWPSLRILANKKVPSLGQEGEQREGQGGASQKTRGRYGRFPARSTYGSRSSKKHESRVRSVPRAAWLGAITLHAKRSTRSKTWRGSYTTSCLSFHEKHQGCDNAGAASTGGHVNSRQNLTRRAIYDRAATKAAQPQEAS